jgi:hypothetical protein
MVEKLKGKFMPMDYSLNLSKRILENLKQSKTTVKEYTKEFYIVSIIARHNDESLEPIVRYMNGLIIPFKMNLKF